MASRKTSDNTQSMYWCFTINNPTDNDKSILNGLLKACDAIVWMVWQLEKGENDTPHFQGFMELGRKMRRRTISKLIPRANISCKYAKSSTYDNWKYCTKEEGRLEGPFTLGKVPCWDNLDEWGSKQGERSDIARWASKTIELAKAGNYDILAEAVDDNDNMAYMNCNYFNYKQKLLNAAFPPRSEPPKILYLWGDSGVGKTLISKLLGGPKTYFLSKDNGNGNLWIDGYVPGHTFVIDEFHSWIKYEDIKRFLDASPLQWQIKGGYTQFNSPLIIITSNVPPTSQYAKLAGAKEFKAADMRFALWRRFVEFGLVVNIKAGAKVMPHEIVAFVKEERPKDSNGKILPRPYPSGMTFKDGYPEEIMNRVAEFYKKQFRDSNMEDWLLYAESDSSKQYQDMWLNWFEDIVPNKEIVEEPEVNFAIGSSPVKSPARKKVKKITMEDIIECESDDDQ